MAGVGCFILNVGIGIPRGGTKQTPAAKGDRDAEAFVGSGVGGGRQWALSWYQIIHQERAGALPHVFLQLIGTDAFRHNADAWTTNPFVLLRLLATLNNACTWVGATVIRRVSWPTG